MTIFIATIVSSIVALAVGAVGGDCDQARRMPNHFTQEGGVSVVYPRGAINLDVYDCRGIWPEAKPDPTSCPKWTGPLDLQLKDSQGNAFGVSATASDGDITFGWAQLPLASYRFELNPDTTNFEICDLLDSAGEPLSDGVVSLSIDAPHQQVVLVLCESA